MNCPHPRWRSSSTPETRFWENLRSSDALGAARKSRLPAGLYARSFPPSPAELGPEKVGAHFVATVAGRPKNTAQLATSQHRFPVWVSDRGQSSGRGLVAGRAYCQRSGASRNHAPRWADQPRVQTSSPSEARFAVTRRLREPPIQRAERRRTHRPEVQQRVRSGLPRLQTVSPGFPPCTGPMPAFRVDRVLSCGAVPLPRGRPGGRLPKRAKSAGSCCSDGGQPRNSRRATVWVSRAYGEAGGKSGPGPPLGAPNHRGPFHGRPYCARARRAKASASQTSASVPVCDGLVGLPYAAGQCVPAERRHIRARSRRMHFVPPSPPSIEGVDRERLSEAV